MTLFFKLKNLLSVPVSGFISRPVVFWVSFFLLAAGQFSFSYFSPSLSVKLWILLAGLVVPVLLLFWSLELKKPLSGVFGPGESLPPIPAWVWITIVALAIGLRLFKLTDLSQWPLKDEGIFGYYAVHQMEKWNWALTQGLNRLPTLFTWIQSALFKSLGPSLLTLWLYPAFWSILLLPVVWLASRGFFSRSVSFLVLGVTAFSFWPLFLGRFSTQAVFMVFWEWIEFLALGLFLKAGPTGKKRNLLWLGVITGIGFYTYLAWPSVACLAAMVLLADRPRTHPGSFYTFLAFSFLSGLVALPLILSFTSEHRGYLQHLWSMGSNHNWLERFHLFSAYFADLFWGAPPSTFHYGPLSGGFLNPLADSLFLLGLIASMKFLVPFRLWILSAFPVLFLPALLSNDFEDMRLVQWVPVLSIGTALGIQFFLSSLPSGKRVLFLFLFFAGSASLDLHHLFVIYPQYWGKNLSYYGDHKSAAFYKAYSFLKPLAKLEGPGLILLNYNPDPYDQTLFVATYSFNAAENPGLDPSAAKWAAVLVNVHEQPYLKKIFPGGNWIWLSAGMDRRDGGFLLEVVPIHPGNRGLLTRWVKADQSLKPLTYLIMEFGVDPDQTSMLAVLEKAYPFFKGDPLLESRYWRIMALHHSAEGKIADAVQDEKTAIQRGYPMAHLYDEMGCFLFKENLLGESEKAFREALRLRPNCTDASTNLLNLNLLERK